MSFSEKNKLDMLFCDLRSCFPLKLSIKMHIKGFYRTHLIVRNRKKRYAKEVPRNDIPSCNLGQSLVDNFWKLSVICECSSGDFCNFLPQLSKYSSRVASWEFDFHSKYFRDFLEIFSLPIGCSYSATCDTTRTFFPCWL